MITTRFMPLPLLLLMLPCVAAHGQSGAPAAPPPATAPASVVGTWRGTSICRPVGKPACHDEVAVYHIRRADSAGTPRADAPRSSGVSGQPPSERLVWQGNKVVNGVEEDMATLSCTYDPTSGTALCPMRGWRWVFQAAIGAEGATLVGRLENPAGVVWRDVRVTKVADVP